MARRLLLVLCGLLAVARAFVALPRLSRRAFCTTLPATDAEQATPATDAEQEEGLEAYIEFLAGLPEEDVPEVRITRSRDGSTGTASFTFRQPLAIVELKRLLMDEQRSIQGMNLVDEEGVIECEDVEAVFEAGEPTCLVATHIMRSEDEFERLVRFMDRYAQCAGLAFSNPDVEDE